MGKNLKYQTITSKTQTIRRKKLGRIPQIFAALLISCTINQGNVRIFESQSVINLKGKGKPNSTFFHLVLQYHTIWYFQFFPWFCSDSDLSLEEIHHIQRLVELNSYKELVFIKMLLRAHKANKHVPM